MKNKNHNIRFNTEKADECRAWELLHSQKVRQMFKSQNKFVIEAVNDYMETREKEDAFAERIVEAVEKKMLSNLPALFGMYMAQMRTFPLSVPMGVYPAAQGGMMYGQTLADGAGNGNATMNGPAPKNEAAQGRDTEAGHSTEPPDNDLIDFDAF